MCRHSQEVMVRLLNDMVSLSSRGSDTLTLTIQGLIQTKG